MSAETRAGELTLGPVLFNWSADTWRDFYFRMADEAPVDIVYVGEVVCYKRAPLFNAAIEPVVTRLEAAGKRVILTSLAEVMAKQERAQIDAICAEGLIEANDAAALYHLRGRPHHVGPYVNAYNESTLAVLAKNGAVSVCLPPEMPGAAVAKMCAAAPDELAVEVQVFGRIPLALSARCYHARAHHRTKDTCQYVCEKDPDGMTLRTLEDRPFLTINGIQTMSHSYLNLAGEIAGLQAMGVTRFRLSPHTCDMVLVARVFRDLMNGATDAESAHERLAALGLDAPFCNGFYAGHAGQTWTPPVREG